MFKYKKTMQVICGDKVNKNIGYHNLYIGVSLGNKFFSERKNIIKYINFSLKYNSKKVVFLIADSIQVYNYIWQRGISMNKAQEIAAEESLKKIEFIENILQSNYPTLEYEIIRWQDVTNNQHYKENLEIVMQQYYNKSDFYHYLYEFVSNYISSIGRTVKQKSVDNSILYLLQEIPFLVGGFKYQGVVYSAYPYPNIGVGEILKAIQNNQFNGLNKKLSNYADAIQIILE